MQKGPHSCVPSFAVELVEPNALFLTSYFERRIPEPIRKPLVPSAFSAGQDAELRSPFRSCACQNGHIHFIRHTLNIGLSVQQKAESLSSPVSCTSESKAAYPSSLSSLSKRIPSPYGRWCARDDKITTRLSVPVFFAVCFKLSSSNSVSRKCPEEKKKDRRDPHIVIKSSKTQVLKLVSSISLALILYNRHPDEPTTGFCQLQADCDTEPTDFNLRHDINYFANQGGRNIRVVTGRDGT